MPRFAGLPSFMRLPVLTDPALVDVALVGVPFDGGTTNRAGARHGPAGNPQPVQPDAPHQRQRHFTLRAFAGRRPWRCAGESDRSSGFTNKDRRLFPRSERRHPITAGGDHLITLPILRALAKPPVGLVQFDSHSDTNDKYFGENLYTHGTPFRRAVEEGLLDPKRCVQIAIRGSYYHPTDFDFARAAGFRMFTMDEVMDRGIAEVMAETNAIIGDAPVYTSRSTSTASTPPTRRAPARRKSAA